MEAVASERQLSRLFALTHVTAYSPQVAIVSLSTIGMFGALDH